MSISNRFEWSKLTPEDGSHYFFGYYDRNPWDPQGEHHLVLRVDQADRLPEPGETADIGIVDRRRNLRLVTRTRAWNHQQGAMELFLPRRPGCFIYNDLDADTGRLIARIFDLKTNREIGHFDVPIYAITPDGHYGISLDFGRIPRRGYSYADAPLPPDLQPADPDRSGLTLVDLTTGQTKLIVSYRTMLARHPFGYGLAGQRIWLNHAIFNCNGSRVLWLLRHCDEDNRSGCFWRTYMYTSDLSGSDVACILPEPYWTGQISHQIWGRTPREILVDANWLGKGHAAVVFDESCRPFVARSLSAGTGRMAHLVFSPDGSRILADSYPDADGMQTLSLLDAASGAVETLGRFRHRQLPGTPVDVRCDLHPRWSRDGKTVTVDSIHDGKRALYLLELPQ